MTEKEIEAEIKKIPTAIFDLDKFPPANVSAFLNASTKAMSIAQISPFFVTMIAKSGLAFNPYLAGLANVRIDLSGGSSDVVTYNNFKTVFAARLGFIKSMVKTLLPGDNATLVLLKLDKVSYYEKGKQSDLNNKLDDLLTQAKTKAAIATVLPYIISLKSDMSTAFDTKSSQFISVDTDRTKIVELIKVVKIALTSNFGLLLDQYSTNLETVLPYFPISLLYNKVHAPDFLYKNQELIEKPLTPIVYISKLRATKGLWIKVQNFGSEPMQLWRSVNVTTTIPDDAATIGTNETATIFGGDIGVDKAYCLMAGFSGDLQMVNAKFTMRKKK